jgi:uncharacterized protein YeaC (DUF1315 family)
MQVHEILQLVTPEVHAGLRRAVELGKWPDGTVLSREQRELCLQALIAWEAHALAPEERTGFIDRGHKAVGERCADEPAVVRIVRDRGA